MLKPQSPIALDTPPQAGPGKQVPLREHLRAHVDQHQSVRAAELIIGSVSHGLLPGGEGLLEWLREFNDEDKTLAAVVDGFARMPSACCHAGLQKCDACEGGGFVDTPCQRCAALGVLRCPCCGGTALLAPEQIPDPLRLPALVRRTHVAIAAFDRVERAALPDGDDSLQSTSHQILGLARHLLSLGKVLSVLEETWSALGQWPTSDADVEPLVKRIDSRARRARGRQAEAVRCLASVWQRRARCPEPASSAAGPGPAEFAGLYEGLLQRGFANTGLAYPFLFDADRVLWTDAAGSQQEGVPGTRPPARSNPTPAVEAALQSRVA